MTKQQFEDKFDVITSKTLIGVKYYEIDYSNKKPLWNWNKDFDSLDYGLDLEFNDGTTCGIIWDSEFVQYGISIIPNSLRNILNGFIVWDVSSEKNWETLIGQKIKAYKIFWDEVFQDSKKFIFPQSIEIIFTNDCSIYISAYEIREDGLEMGMMDNITVFFDSKVAEKYNFMKFD